MSGNVYPLINKYLAVKLKMASDMKMLILFLLLPIMCLADDLYLKDKRVLRNVKVLDIIGEMVIFDTDEGKIIVNKTEIAKFERKKEEYYMEAPPQKKQISATNIAIGIVCIVAGGYFLHEASDLGKRIELAETLHMHTDGLENEQATKQYIAIGCFAAGLLSISQANK